MWKVILLILALSPANEIVQNEEIEVKDIATCVNNVEHLMNSVPEENSLSRNTYFAACKLEPEVKN